MTDRDLILQDLLISRASAEAIREHTDIPLNTISAILADEEIAGTVESKPLLTLTIWQLTERGQNIATLLPKHTLIFPEN